MIRGLEEEANQLFSSRNLVRLAAAKFAEEKKFKGIIFADIAGGIDSIRGVRAAAAELPVFTPLIGCDEEELMELAVFVGVNGTELLPHAEPQSWSQPSTLDLPKNLDYVQVEQLLL